MTNEERIAQARDKLEKLNAAYDAALSAQEYTIGNRSKRNATLSTIVKEMARWEQVIARCSAGHGVSRGVPIDI